MLRDYTQQIIGTASRFKPRSNAVDWKSIGDSLKSMDTSFKAQDLASALESGDEEAINKAKAALDPAGYAKYLDDQAIRAEDRAWALEDQATKQRNALDLLAQQQQNALALENIRNQNARGLAEYKAGLDGQDTTAMRNMNYLISQGYSPQEAAALYYGGQNSTLDLSNLGKKGQEAYDKAVGADLAQQDIAERQMQTLRPRVESAIKRARESLREGTGLGQIGGMGWTTGQGGINRSNIKNAQAQINTTMRGLLKQMGVGSTELNSAAEAEAYRYQLDPQTPIAQQEQVLNNFTQDYLDGSLAQRLQETYGKKNKSYQNMSNEDLLRGL